MANRPMIVFDVNETLLDLETMAPVFERIFRDWRKVPFTCTYLPGKAPAWMIMLRIGIAAPLLGAAGHLMLRASADLIPAVALLTFELAVWWRLRSARRAAWEGARLQFEEIEEAPVMSLELQPAVELERSRPAGVSEMFGLVRAARGLGAMMIFSRLMGIVTKATKPMIVQKFSR